MTTYTNIIKTLSVGSNSYLLTESLLFLTTEDGNRIILEQGGGEAWSNTNKQTTTYTNILK